MVKTFIIFYLPNFHTKLPSLKYIVSSPLPRKWTKVRVGLTISTIEREASYIRGLFWPTLLHPKQRSRPPPSL